MRLFRVGVVLAVAAWALGGGVPARAASSPSPSTCYAAAGSGCPTWASTIPPTNAVLWVVGSVVDAPLGLDILYGSSSDVNSGKGSLLAVAYNLTSGAQSWAVSGTSCGPVAGGAGTTGAASAALSPDGSRFYAASLSGVCALDASTGNLVWSVSTSTSDQIINIAVAATASLVAVASADQTTSATPITAYNAGDGSVAWSVNEALTSVSAAVASSDGSAFFLAAAALPPGGGPSTTELVRVAASDGSSSSATDANATRPDYIALSTDGTAIAMVGRDGNGSYDSMTVTGWNPSTVALSWQQTVAPTSSTGYLDEGIAFAPDDSVYALGQLAPPSNSPIDGVVAAFSAAGTPLWTTNIGEDHVTGLVVVNGEVAVAGAMQATSPQNATSTNSALALLSLQDGSVTGIDEYNTSADGSDADLGMTVASDGTDAYLAGRMYTQSAPAGTGGQHALGLFAAAYPVAAPPPPVVPEAPATAMLLVVGAVVAGGVTLGWRRRRGA